MQTIINEEINQAIEWYYRQGKRYYYRIFYKLPGQPPILRAVMDEALTGNKEASADKLRQELQYIATRGEFPVYLRVGGSANDANPSEMIVFPRLAQQNAIVPYQQQTGIAGISNLPGGGIYGPEHVNLIKENAQLEHQIKMLEYKQQTSGNQFWVDLANSELGKNLIAGLLGIAQTLGGKNPASLAGFGGTQQQPQIQNFEQPMATQQQEITMEQLYVNYIEPLDQTLQTIKPGYSIFDLLTKLNELGKAAAAGDPIAKFKINTALNNL